MRGRDQEYLTLKERLEILFGIRGAASERAVRLKELNALADRVTRLREELNANNRKGHFAYKEGPSAIAVYQNTWSVAGGRGDSLDANESATGIRVLRDGIYRCRYVHRSSGVDIYGCVAESASRSTLETRADGMWNHSHSSVSNMYYESNYLGPLYAGEFITAGPSQTANVPTGGSFVATLSVERIA